MGDRKRVYIWISMILAGVLSLPGKRFVQADADIGLSDNAFSANIAVENGISENSARSGSISDSRWISETGLVVGDGESAWENNAPEGMVFENDEDAQKEQGELSDNSLSSNIMDAEDLVFGDTISEDQYIGEGAKKEPFQIVLPTDIPFNIILFGEEGFDALVRSEQYCIENRGDKDVRVSIQGYCSGDGEEDYIVAKSSVKEDFIQGKKNVWICLKWEDEEREILEHPGILMGEIGDPGTGEIILKAPKKDKEGKIVGDNSDSKMYFSFVGDMKSDTGHPWKSEELELGLDFLMETMTEDAVDAESNPNVVNYVQEEINPVDDRIELFGADSDDE